MNKLLQSFDLSTIANGFQKTAVTDELNRPHTVHSGGLGRTIRTNALHNGATVSTSYQYDLLDRRPHRRQRQPVDLYLRFFRSAGQRSRPGPRQLVLHLQQCRPAHRPDRGQAGQEQHDPKDEGWSSNLQQQAAVHGFPWHRRVVREEGAAFTSSLTTHHSPLATHLMARRPVAARHGVRPPNC